MTQTVPLAHLASAKPSAAESSSRKTLGALALAVAKAKRIVVVTGAGISCSSGIPDFRSSDGLYNLVKSRYPEAVLKGRDLFDAALFRDPTSSAVFYTFMAELKTQIDSAHPAPVHDFLATLDAKGKLLRSYTQNIDGLEERAGLHTGECNPAGGGPAGHRPKNVQLHGDIHRVRCTLCSASMACTSEHIDQFRTGTPPDCPECIARSDARTARSARALKCGTLRPAIVLYDEPHPLGDQIGAVQTSDLGKRPDLLIVMGTSLKVHGLRKLVKSFAKAVHSSRPLPAANATSHSLLHNVVFGEADAWVAQVLGEWKKCRPGDWEVQSTLDPLNIAKLGAKDNKSGKGGKEGKEAGKKGPGKKAAKAGGAENTPPEASQPSRCVIVLPKFKAKVVKSPLKAGSLNIKNRATQLKGKPQLGMSSPRRLGAGSLKRPAPSPLAPRQTKLEIAFRSPARITPGVGSTTMSRLSSGSTLSSAPLSSESSSPDESSPTSTDEASSSATSALSSQVDLSQTRAPLSQESRSSTLSTSHDSIFSSQSTASSQTTVSASGSASCSQSDGSQSNPNRLFSQSGLARYTGPVRPAPFRRRLKTVSALDESSEWTRPERQRAGTAPAGEPLSALGSQVSVGAPPTPSGSMLGSSGSLLGVPTGPLLAPTHSKRYVGAIKSPAAVPRVSYWDEGSPRKKGRVSGEGEKEDTTEDEEVERGLLFRDKGKSKEEDVIDLDPDDDDDSMSLDGAVGHMSLDGPVPEEIVDVEGDTDIEMEAAPVPDPTPAAPPPPVSPVQTRAKRRAKEKEVAAATTKRGSKKAARPRPVPMRASRRIAALAN
ncbi:NAD-dependent histone deacetylase SIR2 [Ceratobasidium sp. AG-Ba]|nr:NAD-dependent histone deacetylase SIR2 [Ceratobasidium sp. AG-Ba]